MQTQYDAFISHASEDKETLVRPLAELLQRLGLTVWYDEFVLGVGDSLSRSIDKGLASCRFGVVVLSKAFLEKKWPEYELRGLVTRELDGNALILPLWHGVDKKEVAEYSPTLADKVAIGTGQLDHGQIALRLIKVIRPDIFRSVSRWVLWQKLRRDGKPELVAADSLRLGPVRHATLSSSLLVRTSLLHSVLGPAGAMSLQETIENFQRDLYPHEEIERWEHLAAAFLRASIDARLSDIDPQQLLSELLALSLRSAEENIATLRGSPDGRVRALLEAYAGVVPALQAQLAPAEKGGNV